MTAASSTDVPRLPHPSTLVRATWQPRTWLCTAHVVLGALLSPVGCVAVLSLSATAAALSPTVVLAAPVVLVLFWFSDVLASCQRSRFRSLLGVSIAPLPPPGSSEASWLNRLWSHVRRRSTWRQLAYHVVCGVTAAMSGVLVVGCWATGAVLSTIVVHGWSLPDRTLAHQPLHSPQILISSTALGLLLLLVAPWLARVGARLDVALAQALLAPTGHDLLNLRIANLTRSRDDTIDAADAERRKLERDLHDGTQQRLVSIAVNLGLSRSTLTDDVPDELRETIVQAHDDVKLALAELRDLVRGLHPAILEDLGLDAALSGIAARSGVPVALRVDLSRRPPRAQETVAYFVICEAMSNAAKHADATRVDVSVTLIAQTLRLEVSDNGRGGADPSRGTGLRGLSQRVQSVDGTLRIASPIGGPTTLTAEIPCAS